MISCPRATGQRQPVLSRQQLGFARPCPSTRRESRLSIQVIPPPVMPEKRLARSNLQLQAKLARRDRRRQSLDLQSQAVHRSIDPRPSHAFRDGTDKCGTGRLVPWVRVVVHALDDLDPAVEDHRSPRCR